MEVDATLLGSPTPLAPGSFRSLASSSHNVSLTFILAIDYPPIDLFLACSKHPLWKQLINDALTADERSSLIVKIFSDRDEIEMVMQLFGDDAQAFIDAIAGVSLHISNSTDKSIDFDIKLHLVN